MADYHIVWLLWGIDEAALRTAADSPSVEPGLGEEWFTVRVNIASGHVLVQVSTGAPPEEWLAQQWTHSESHRTGHLHGELAVLGLTPGIDTFTPLDLTVPPGDHTITLRQFTVPEEYDGHGMNDTAERAWLHIGSPH